MAIVVRISIAWWILLYGLWSRNWFCAHCENTVSAAMSFFTFRTFVSKNMNTIIHIHRYEIYK